MASQLVPAFDDATSDQTTNLDGAPFLLELTWNPRTSTWLLDLYTAEGDPIANGIKLVCNWNLLRSVALPTRPPGRLVVITRTTDDSPPGLEDLLPGARCALAYAPIADVEAALAP